MIWILILALLGIECTSAGGVSGEKSGNKDVFQKYGVQPYVPEKDYIKNERNDQGPDKNNDRVSYQDGYQAFNDKQNPDNQNGYRDDGDSYDDRQKYDKYEGPEEYITSYISDRRRLYEKRDRYFDEEYRNSNNKDCYDKDGKQLGTEKCRKSDSERNNDKDCIDSDGKRFNNERCHDYDGRDCYDSSGKLFNSDRCRSYDRRRFYEDKEHYCYDNYRYYNDTDCLRDGMRFYDNDKCQYENSREQYYDRCYGDVNLVGLGRNDREDQLIRPCALEDWQCIRKYFARNSKCKIAYGPIPDPLYLKRNTVYLPFANLTLVITRMRTTGLGNIKISEFYVNKDTGNLVISLDFRILNQTSPRVFFRYQRTSKESIVLSDYATLEFNSGTFTAVIPKVPNLRLDLAEIHEDTDDPSPVFFIGPRAYNSTDPDVQASFATLLADRPTAVREYLLFQTQLFTAIYIQENICDFGLKLISV